MRELQCHAVVQCFVLEISTCGENQGGGQVSEDGLNVKVPGASRGPLLPDG